MAYLKANKMRTMRTMIASDPKTTAIAIITVVVVSLRSDGVGITAEMCSDGVGITAEMCSDGVGITAEMCVCVCVCVCV